MVLFDVPITQNAQRAKLRRYLTEQGFGYLQKSVWVTPNPFDEQRKAMENGKIDVESLILLEARPATGESDEQIVSGAWDFDRINHRYSIFMKTLEDRPTKALTSGTTIKAFRRWAAAERKAWLHAIAIDPLLPEVLLPQEYLGRHALQQRIQTLQQAHILLKTFNSNNIDNFK
jgi:DNA-binding transcriptional regulator PaaX